MPSADLLRLLEAFMDSLAVQVSAEVRIYKHYAYK
jgi:hypothetical protein